MGGGPSDKEARLGRPGEYLLVPRGVEARPNCGGTTPSMSSFWFKAGTLRPNRLGAP